MHEEGIEMKKILFLFCLVIPFLFPSLSSAGCVDIGGFSGFSLQGAKTVVLYSGTAPVASFDVQSCGVQPSSKIELIKSYVCDGEDVMIDGIKCTILDIKRLGS